MTDGVTLNTSVLRKNFLQVILLAIGIRPYYLAWEFLHVIAITVYITPSADAAAACELLHTTVSQLQTLHPHCLLISGDFNHVSLSSTLPTPHSQKPHQEVSEELRDCFETTDWEVQC